MYLCVRTHLSFLCVCVFVSPKKKSLLPNFVQIPMCNYVGPKKIKGGHNFFLKIKNHKFFKFIYNNNNFFLSQCGPMTTLNPIPSHS